MLAANQRKYPKTRSPNTHFCGSRGISGGGPLSRRNKTMTSASKYCTTEAKREPARSAERSGSFVAIQCRIEAGSFCQELSEKPV